MTEPAPSGGALLKGPALGPSAGAAVVQDRLKTPSVGQGLEGTHRIVHPYYCNQMSLFLIRHKGRTV